MTRTRLLLALMGMVGFATGAVTIAVLDPGADPPPDATTAEPSAPPVTSPPAPAPSASVDPASVDPASVDPASVDPASADPTSADPSSGEPRLLVWTSGGLVAGLAESAAAVEGVHAVSMVRGAELALVEVVDAAGVTVESYTDGWALPLDVLAIDPSRHARFVETDDGTSVGGLGPGEGLLSTTSADLRGVGPGAVLRFEGGDVAVVGVVDDLSAAGAELVVDQGTGRGIGVTVDRFLLIGHEGDREALQAALDAEMTRLGAPAPARYRAAGETTWLRHGDAVLPAAHVKARFGEFAVRDLAGRDVEIEADWVAANIVTVEFPIVGQAQCHRLAVEPLTEALRALVEEGISHVVDGTQFGGCFAPRRIGAGLSLSRHSWGIAVDINVGDNPRGSFASQDARLVDAMRAEGFGWGGVWLVPDPAHYEAIAFP